MREDSFLLILDLFVFAPETLGDKAKSVWRDHHLNAYDIECLLKDRGQAFTVDRRFLTTLFFAPEFTIIRYLWDNITIERTTI